MSLVVFYLHRQFNCSRCTWHYQQQQNISISGYESLIGSNDESLGWDIVKNIVLYNDCVVRNYPDGVPDVFVAPAFINVILDMDSGTLAFKGGNTEYGVAITGLRTIGKPLYPAISAVKDDCKIRIQYIETETEGINISYSICIYKERK